MTDILFWSGGKDAYLALLFYQKISLNKIILLTTYDESINTVPFQNISMETIREQSEYLKLNILSVPLPSYCPNDIYIKKVTHSIQLAGEHINALIFGDLWIEDIRIWREKTFSDYDCRFPLWHKKYSELLNVLWNTPADIYISNIMDDYKEYIKIGDSYDQAFIDTLPDFIDPMGEKGEFHTKVVFHE
jgi:diphthamide synthase (EF-2-diphthine--ammonia ligase)